MFKKNTPDSITQWNKYQNLMTYITLPKGSLSLRL